MIDEDDVEPNYRLMFMSLCFLFAFLFIWTMPFVGLALVVIGIFFFGLDKYQRKQVTETAKKTYEVSKEAVHTLLERQGVLDGGKDFVAPMSPGESEELLKQLSEDMQLDDKEA